MNESPCFFLLLLVIASLKSACIRTSCLVTGWLLDNDSECSRFLLCNISCPWLLKRTRAKCCDMCLLAGVRGKKRKEKKKAAIIAAVTSQISESEGPASSVDKAKGSAVCEASWRQADPPWRSCCCWDDGFHSSSKRGRKRHRCGRGAEAYLLRANVAISPGLNPWVWVTQAYASTAHSWLSLNRRPGSKRTPSLTVGWHFTHGAVS